MYVKTSYFFYEIGFNFISFRPDFAEYISLRAGSIEYKGVVPVYLKQYEFTDDVSERTVIDENKPTQYPKDSYPFSNIYFRFGLKIEI